MGCLLELFFEIIFECFIEAVFCCYIKLMQLIVPQKNVSPKAREAVKNTVIAVAVVLMITLIIGFIFLMQSKPTIKAVGRYMTFIPLIIIAVQIVLGITVKIVSRLKK